MSGKVIGALDAHGVQGAQVSVTGLQAVTTDPNGFFTLNATGGMRYRATLTGADLVDRQTMIAAPSSGLELSLIPKSFDLSAFDELCRSAGARLQRWSRPPSLVVISSTLAFTSTTDSSFTASAERLSAVDHDGLVADLAWGLPQMTGNAFTAFGSVSTESAGAGTIVSVQRDNFIVVARFGGLTSATGYVGFGRWAVLADGTVTAGIMFLDADFDAGSALGRRAVRVHELGHALGYMHVFAESSNMNASASVEPNAFDRSATLIAFQRAPGSRSPDIDPDTVSTNAMKSTGPAAWGPVIP